MKISTLLSICTLTLFSSALPLSDPRSEPQVARRKAPYSVVPVDGGQPTGVAPPQIQVVTKDSTQTVTESPKTMPPVTETRLSTTVVTLSETPTTIITTITTTSTPTTIETGASEVSHSITTSISTVTTMASAADTVTITSTPNLTPYDDGKWHTTYYKTEESSSSSATISSIAINHSPSPVVDVDATMLTNTPSNGTYALVMRGKKEPKPSILLTTGTITKNGTWAAATSKPPMPKLPKTSEFINPTQVPSIDVAQNMVPGFYG